MTESTGRLHELGLKHGTDKATFHRYCDFYEQHLPARVDRLLEIGIMEGASLRMWRDYYPDADLIAGVDNDEHRGRLKITGVRTVWLDATDPSEVELLVSRLGPFDVIIDDASHMTADQQKTFELLWPAVTPGGVYVIEDLHTSYMSNYINTPENTVDWLEQSGRRVAWFYGKPARPDDFLGRHGFPLDKIDWVGADVAQSITAIITKDDR